MGHRALASSRIHRPRHLPRATRRAPTRARGRIASSKIQRARRHRLASRVDARTSFASDPDAPSTAAATTATRPRPSRRARLGFTATVLVVLVLVAVVVEEENEDIIEETDDIASRVSRARPPTDDGRRASRNRDRAARACVRAFFRAFGDGLIDES